MKRKTSIRVQADCATTQLWGSGRGRLTSARVWLDKRENDKTYQTPLNEKALQK